MRQKHEIDLLQQTMLNLILCRSQTPDLPEARPQMCQKPDPVEALLYVSFLNE